MRRTIQSALFGLVWIGCLCANGAPGDTPLNKAIAETPGNVSVAIVKTGRAMDGGSILNNIKFSDGRLYTLVLNYPLDIATNKVTYPDIHFVIFVPDDWARHETLEHGSSSEKRLIDLLERLAATSNDPHEKKDASSLVTFLKDRTRGFPAGRKWWDFTPW
jgi:hypothetical protein